VNIIDLIDEHLCLGISLKNDSVLLNLIISASEIIFDSFSNNGKLLICGNGGSAADAQHIETEMVSRFQSERKALHAEALTVNTSTLTAIGNDYEFNKIFSRQVEAKGKQGDVLLAISTSGKSKSILNAVSTARSSGIKTVGLTGGKDDNPLVSECDIAICVPSKNTPRIQEIHVLVYHIICELVEKKIIR
jgi:D-sedoheptulose 7-phosphate isomerase